LDFTSHILKLYASYFRNAEKAEDIFCRIKQPKSRSQRIKVISSRLNIRQIRIAKLMQGKSMHTGEPIMSLSQICVWVGYEMGLESVEVLQ
jgi:hypothetical protein